MASSRYALVALLVLLSCAAAVSAARYTIGDGQGWSFGGDYNNWANGKTFAVGDELEFNFADGQHDVVKTFNDTCSTSNAMWTQNQSPVITRIDSIGYHYYICSFPNHCSSGGMKLTVFVNPGTPPATGLSAPLQAGGPVALAMAAAAVLVKLALF